jgi:hypothetical protein
VIKGVYGNVSRCATCPRAGAEEAVVPQPAALGLWQTHDVRRRVLVLLGDPGVRRVRLRPKVLGALNLKGDWASFGSVAITLLFVVGCIIATRLINSMGRRNMLIHSFFWSGLACWGWGCSTLAPSC